MVVQDGFIVGVFEYCDRWCERCALTSRCRLFADQPVARSLHRIIAADAVPAASAQGSGADDFALPPDLEPSLGPDPRVTANARQLRMKFDRARRSANPAVRLAMETIQHFSIFVPLRMMRALSGAARADDSAGQSDANGAGKAALLGLERMRGAWQTLIETKQFTSTDAAGFLAEIDRLTRNVERSLPDVLAFIRPGFDEPEEVGKLNAETGRH